MIVAAPFWLLLLVPLAALAVWLLRVQPVRRTVPFIELWQGNEFSAKRADRRLVRPPKWIVFALLALLGAIVGAAGPALRHPGRGPQISVIVDRGVTMPGGDQYKNLLGQAEAEISRAFSGMGRLDLLLVPGTSRESSDRSDWASLALRHPPTAINNRGELKSTVETELRSADRPVVVITNQNLAIKDEHLFTITLTTQPSNVGIVALSARIDPVPAVMVTIRNQSPLKQAKLTVQSLGQSTARDISLPGFNQQQNYFVDVPGLDEVVGVDLEVADDLPSDNRAWLVRSAAWPKVEAAAPLSAELTRMIDVYSRGRRAAESSPHVVVTDSLFKLSEKSAAAAVYLGGASSAEPRRNQRVRVYDHPIVEGIDWSKVLGDADVLGAPGNGWQPILESGDAVFVAVRERPARQVWVGFYSPSFAKLPEFVIFWTKVFDWLGQSESVEYRCSPVRQLGSNWVRLDDISGPLLTAQPTTGVYQTLDGRMQALCALDVKLDDLPPRKPPSRGWKGANLNDATAISLRRPLLVASAILVALAALTMPAKARKTAENLQT